MTNCTGSKCTRITCVSNYLMELYIWPILNKSLIRRSKGIGSSNSVRGCKIYLIWPQEAKVRTVLCDMTNKTIMAAAREITPYIRLRSGFTMIKKGPAMEPVRRWIVRIVKL